MRINHVYGRDADVDNIEHQLNQTRVVSLKAIGGLGKTTLAKLYLARKRDQYHYCCWIDLRDILIESFSNAQLVFNLGLSEQVASLPKNSSFYRQVFELVCNQLRNLRGAGKNLLILDNAGEQLQYQDIYDQLSLDDNWHIIITSREKLLGPFEYKVDFLQEEKAIALFTEFYTVENDPVLIKEIIAILGRHTLAIELLAKSAQERTGTKLSDIRAALIAEGLSAMSGKEIQTAYDKINHVYTYLTKCLRVAFELSDLNSIDQEQLACFSILTANFYSTELLNKLLPQTAGEQDVLNRLSRKGWLFKEQDAYSMHQVIQDSIREQLRPSVNSCRSVFDYFGYPFREEMESKLSRRFGYTEFISDLSALLKHAVRDNEALRSPLLYNLATLKWLRGEQIEANELNCQAVKIYEVYFPDTEKIAQLYNNFGITNWDLSHYKDAEEFLLKSIKIFERLGAQNFEADLATSYNNLSLVYWDMMDMENAEKYQLMTIALREKLFKGQDHPYLAQSYSNLSIIYIRRKQFVKALRWQLRAFHIRERILQPNDPELAQTYHNLSVIYCQSGKLIKANYFSEKALDIRLNYLKPLSPDIAVSYDNLATIRKYEKNYEEALSYQKQGLAIRLSPGYGRQLPLAKSYLNLADIYFQKGNAKSASEALNEAIEIERQLDFRAPTFEKECQELLSHITESMIKE